MANWDERWINTAALQASFSKDRSTKVGAVIVSNDQVVVSMGWNGFPRGCDDNDDSLHERPTKYLWTVHAELNAVLNAARKGRAIENCTLYCTHSPCAACSLLIAQAGIRQVVVPAIQNEDFRARWLSDLAISQEIFARMKVIYRSVDVPIIIPGPAAG